MNNFFNKTTLVVLVIILNASCVGIKPTNSGKISKYIEEFYTAEGNIQYFVKPIKYSDNNNDDASIDFTLRNRSIKTDSLTTNISVFSKMKNEATSITLIAANNTYTINHVTTIFTEKKDDLYIHRLSIKIPYNQFENIFFQDHQLKIDFPENLTTINPTKNSINKYQKIISILKQNLK